MVFGVTSAQNSAGSINNTLHVCRLQGVDPRIETPKQFQLALRSCPRPGRQRLKIRVANQIKISIQLYRDVLEGGIKTTTYMQMVADRGRNLFNPFSVQDVHMARVFGASKRKRRKRLWSMRQTSSEMDEVPVCSVPDESPCR